MRLGKGKGIHKISSVPRYFSQMEMVKCSRAHPSFVLKKIDEGSIGYCVKS